MEQANANEILSFPEAPARIFEVDLQKRIEEARELHNQDRYLEATAAYEKLVQLCPQSSQIWFEYGSAAGNARLFDLFDRAWKKAMELDPHAHVMRLHMGHQYALMRMPDKAKAAFEAAAQIAPAAIDPQIALAMFYERNHQFSEAREIVEHALTKHPRDDQALYFSALLDRREKKLVEAESGLRDLLASGPRHEFVQYGVRYELAEVLNATERYDEAMEMLRQAKEILQSLANVSAMYSEYDEFAKRFKSFTRGFPRNILKTWAREFPERSRESIPPLAFLGGHPRSGTTLLEQILGAHPDIAAIDESLSFDFVVARMHEQSGQLPPSRLNIMRKKYFEAILMEAGSYRKGQLVLDKNPSPTVRLRIWLRVFPELRVIIALRDPRDVIISCYFQNIALNAVNANFLTLERAAKHYSNLMDVWLTVREWEGLRAIETRYEDVVADTAKEGRRVTEFLGLNWHEDQERFYDKSSKKRINSPTYHEASQPIYKRAVARWPLYEKHLKPILPILEPYCKKLGYDT